LQQSHKFLSYSPAPFPDSVLVYKPHGSSNLYVNRARSEFCFADPGHVSGNFSFRDRDGTLWSPSDGLVPPRLDKRYEQHPIAARILGRFGEAFSPTTVTFWGVSLTSSDVDLLDIFRTACERAERVEFINPSAKDALRAHGLLGVELAHFLTLDDWVASPE